MAAPRAEIPIVVLSETSPTSPVSGATAVVKYRASGTEAPVYENAGTTETKLTQPLTTNTRGALTGWLPRGSYTIEITLPGKTPYVEYLDIIPGADETIDTNFIVAEAITSAKIAAALKNPAAGTAGLRTLGTGATEAAAGNDSRLTNERVPTAGSVTTAKIVDGNVTEAKLAAQSVSTNKINTAFANLLATYTTMPGVGSPKITRGASSVEVVQPGGQSGGSGIQYVAHGLGQTPGSVQLTAVVAAGYGVMFDLRIFEKNASFFGVQCYSTSMPSERVVVGFEWLTVT